MKIFKFALNFVLSLSLLTPLAQAGNPKATPNLETPLQISNQIVSEKISKMTVKTPESRKLIVNKLSQYLVGQLKLTPVTEQELNQLKEKIENHKKKGGGPESSANLNRPEEELQLIDEVQENCKIKQRVEPLTLRETCRVAAGKLYHKTLGNLLESSIQFLFCNAEDWGCLEKDPILVPSTSTRVDTKPFLGKPIQVNENFEATAYFTRRWWERLANIQSKHPSMAEVLADKLVRYGTKSVSMALYGIDRIKDTMKPVYDAVIHLLKIGSNVRGVFDVKEAGKPNSFLRDYKAVVNGSIVTVMPTEKPLSYSYLVEDTEHSVFATPSWIQELVILGEKNIKPEIRLEGISGSKYAGDIKWLSNRQNADKARTAVRLAFQYKDTMNLVSAMNSGISSDVDSRARMEEPANNLMHNKFFVMEDQSGQKYVWTGTTNVSNTCMGNEDNANMSLFIKSHALSKVFEDEFEEMFQPNPKETKDKFYTGNFHNRKRPNTNRYLTFADGTEVKIHFSPTDDGTHRSIIPMILSARKGDKIRISMFGGSGIEFVRALQYAQARGAQIQISMDLLTGSGRTMWYNSEEGSLEDRNPFFQNMVMGGTLEFRYNNWNGLNHHKTATLSRKQKDGSYKTEVMIVGSQNWTDGGNDLNDENMLTIRNKSQSLTIGDQFNQEFDNNIWPNSATKQEMKDKKPPKSEDDEE